MTEGIPNPTVNNMLEQIDLSAVPQRKKGFKSTLKAENAALMKREILYREALSNSLPMQEFNKFLNTLMEVVDE